MNNLADAVLDYYFFLYFVEKQNPNAECSIKLVELFDQIENKFSDVEKQEVKEAAKRRFQRQEEVINSGGIPQYPINSEEIEFLQNIARGNFDTSSMDNIPDPDQDLSDIAEE